MRWTRLARNACLGVSLLCLGLPEAEALEIFAPPSVAAHMDDGLITQVRGGRGAGGCATAAVECIAAAAECIAAVGRIAAAGRIAVVALTVGEPIAAAPIVAGRPTVGARTAVAPTVAGRPTEAALIVARLIAEACIAAAPTVMAVGPVPGTAGRLAEPSQPARRLASSARRRRRLGRAPLPGRASAGTTPTRAGGRASGTPASKPPDLRTGLALRKQGWAGLEVAGASRGVGVSNALAGPEGAVQRASDRSTTARLETSATSERSARSIDHHRNKFNI